MLNQGTLTGNAAFSRDAEATGGSGNGSTLRPGGSGAQGGYGGAGGEQTDYVKIFYSPDHLSVTGTSQLGNAPDGTDGQAGASGMAGATGAPPV